MTYFIKPRAAITIFLFSAFMCTANAFTFNSKTDPEVVSTVDITRYVGSWYEIAHSPNFFQRGCEYSTAEYQIINAESISVHNVCHHSDNTISDIEGTATIVDPAVPAKLKVRFNFFARGDYWITELDQNYQWAVVSGPGKKSLFILSRVAPMDKELLQQILTTLENKGFDTTDLIYDKY